MQPVHGHNFIILHWIYTGQRLCCWDHSNAKVKWETKVYWNLESVRNPPWWNRRFYSPCKHLLRWIIITCPGGKQRKPFSRLCDVIYPEVGVDHKVLIFFQAKCTKKEQNVFHIITGRWNFKKIKLKPKFLFAKISQKVWAGVFKLQVLYNSTPISICPVALKILRLPGLVALLYLLHSRPRSRQNCKVRLLFQLGKTDENRKFGSKSPKTGKKVSKQTKIVPNAGKHKFVDSPTQQDSNIAVIAQ